MREILFRGKRQLNGQWIQSDSIMQFEKDFINGYEENTIKLRDKEGFKYIDKTTFGQYTGLTDKHGNKIFEGDILKVASIRTVATCEVVYREGWFIGLTEDNAECEFRYVVDIEIIGNIHDNPDLFKRKPEEE